MKMKNSKSLISIILSTFLIVSCNDGFLDPSIENNHIPFNPVNPTNTPLFVPYSTRVGVFPHSDVISDPNNRFADVTGIHGERWNFVRGLERSVLIGNIRDNIHIFYVWATVNAKGPFGESQYYTAFALQNVLMNGLVEPGHESTVSNIIVRCLVATIDEFPEGFNFDDFTPSDTVSHEDLIIHSAARAYESLRDNYVNIFDISVFRAEFGSIESGDTNRSNNRINTNQIIKVTRVKSDFGWRNNF